jgi:hypothetical protein
VQTPVRSRYPASAPSTNSFCFSCHHAARTGSIEPSLLVSPLLRGPTRLIPFAPALHLHQRKLSRNLHLQYSAKSQSTQHCQSLITPRSNHPPVLERSRPHQLRKTRAGLCGQIPPRRNVILGTSTSPLHFPFSFTSKMEQTGYVSVFFVSKDVSSFLV